MNRHFHQQTLRCGTSPRAALANLVSCGCRGAAPLLAGVPLLLAGAAGAASLTADPAVFSLGSFSTLNPLDSDLVSGTTVIHIDAPGNWQLEARMEGAFRRVSDGLELPLDRISEVYPVVPPSVINLQPYIVKMGNGPRDFIVNWLDLSTGVEPYLQPGDPPGTYEVVLLGRLLDETGDPLTDYIDVTIEFEIVPWVKLLSATLPDFEVPVNTGIPTGESDIAWVTLVANTAWQLKVSGSGDLVAPGGATLPLATLTACLEGGGGSWTPVNGDCIEVEIAPTVIAAGQAPAPFTIASEEIPVVVRFDGQWPIEIGTYDTSLLFEVRTDPVSP